MPEFFHLSATEYHGVPGLAAGIKTPTSSDAKYIQEVWSLLCATLTRNTPACPSSQASEKPCSAGYALAISRHI